MLKKILATANEKILKTLFNAAVEIPLLPGQQYLILSDIHMGNGKSGDDIKANSKLLETILKKYYQNKEHYSSCLLNGDIYELLKFSRREIRDPWQSLKKTLHNFPNVFQIEGNHDRLKEQGFPKEVLNALKLRRAETDHTKAMSLFCFHGHQADSFNSGKFHQLTKVLLRILGFLGIHNPLSKSQFGTPNKTAVEEAVYAFSKKEGVISIIGHTHRPIFESLNKGQYLETQIYYHWKLYEQAKANGDQKAAQDYQDIAKKFNTDYTLYQQKQAVKKDHAAIYSKGFPVPLLFNSGCVIGRSGMTMLELTYDNIALVYWTSEKNDEYESEKTIKMQNGMTYYRYILRQEPLNEIIDKINFLK